MNAPRGYTVLIDGYNVIKRHPDLARRSLEDARKHLVTRLNHTRWPTTPTRVIVVFDAPQSSDALRPHLIGQGKVQSCFAAPSADAYIQQTIRASTSAAQLCVITDDGAIVSTAKSHGVQRHTTQWLLERSGLAITPRRSQHPSDEKTSADATLSAQTARRITEELAARWLRSPNKP